jgi:hypothetical protein
MMDPLRFVKSREMNLRIVLHRRPFTSSSRSMIHRASTCPLDQQKDQKGGSFMRAWISSPVRLCCG